MRKYTAAVFMVAILLLIYLPVAADDSPKGPSLSLSLVHDVRSKMGVESQLWVIMIGDTTQAESMAMKWARYFGSFSLDATLWVKDDLRPNEWKEATYRRPRNLDEVAEFLENKNLFYAERYVAEPPWPLIALPETELQKIDFIITYVAGGTKVYLLPEVDIKEAETFLSVLAEKVKNAVGEKKGEEK